MTESLNPFLNNADGILTHSGEIKVAKGGIRQKILNINQNRKTVLVKGVGNSYGATIHQELLPLIQYANKGDIAFVKFKKNEAFIVGFKKKQ